MEQYTFSNDKGIFSALSCKYGCKVTLRSVDKKAASSTPSSAVVPVLCVDFSYSMHANHSAKPAEDAMRETCRRLFDRGFPTVLLVFWGKSAFGTEVSQATFDKVISDT